MELCDKYLHDYFTINPTINDFFCKDEWLHKRHIQPNIYSEPYYKSILDLNKRYKKILENVNNKTFHDKLLLRIVNYEIHMEEAYEIYMYMPVDCMDNILYEYVTECSGNGYYLFTDKQSFTDFIKRLSSLDDITNEIIKKMRHGIQKKITLYYRVIDSMIDMIQLILKHKSYEYKGNKKTFKFKKHFNENINKYLVKNLQKFLDFLLNEYYQHTSKTFGLHSVKGGKHAYNTIVQHETMKGCTPELIHKCGLRELKRLQKKIQKLQIKLHIPCIETYIKQNKSFYYSSKKEIINDLKKIRKDIKTYIFPKLFYGSCNEYDIKSVPPEKDVDFAYYMPSDLCNKNRGTFFINTSNPEKVNKHEMYVLSLHEGLPGHHYEFEYHRKHKIPDYFKYFGYNSYSEGWGLYCENLGVYNHDIKYYYKLHYEIQRVLRLIIDTAIHWYGWDYDRCFQLMKDNLTYDDSHIHNELGRYISMPGQAVTYKIGEKTILYLRKHFLDHGYSLKDFHKYIMDIGPCPLDTMLEII